VAVSVGGLDRTVRVWDLATGSAIGEPLVGHDGGVLAVAVGELEGRAVAVSGGEETVRVWDLATGSAIGEPLVGHDGGVQAVAVGELEGRAVAVSGGEETVRVWDLAHRRQHGIVLGSAIYSLAVLPPSVIAVGAPEGVMALELVGGPLRSSR